MRSARRPLAARPLAAVLTLAGALLLPAAPARSTHSDFWTHASHRSIVIYADFRDAVAATAAIGHPIKDLLIIGPRYSHVHRDDRPGHRPVSEALPMRRRLDGTAVSVSDARAGAGSGLSRGPSGHSSGSNASGEGRFATFGRSHSK